jgi:hypothetical protein
VDRKSKHIWIFAQDMSRSVSLVHVAIHHNSPADRSLVE